MQHTYQNIAITFWAHHYIFDQILFPSCFYYSL